jgi:hypothetical protein
MLRILAFAALTCLHTGTVFAQTPATPPASTWLPMVLWNGQSDARGQAIIPNGSLETRYRDRAYLYSLGGCWFVMREPSHSTAPQMCGSQYPDVWRTEPRHPPGGSAALYFAEKWLALHPSDTKTGHIGIIAAAVGGACIGYFLPSNNLLRQHYRSTKSRILSQTTTTHWLFAVVLDQGGCDAKDETKANAWAAKFTRYHDAMLADFPGISFIIVEIGDPPPPPLDQDYPYWDVVRQQQALAAATNSSTMLVRARHLGKVDAYHRSLDSQKIVGEAIALALTKLQADPAK